MSITDKKICFTSLVIILSILSVCRCPSWWRPWETKSVYRWWPQGTTQCSLWRSESERGKRFILSAFFCSLLGDLKKNSFSVAVNPPKAYVYVTLGFVKTFEFFSYCWHFFLSWCLIIVKTKKFLLTVLQINIRNYLVCYMHLLVPIIMRKIEK